ncbi:HNH endonuclease [Brachybacterium huguangmaarense]|uniref:HNH endonuclease n=1 Tax=Brachybacterium huguangmaarense TaxID=1652028 RepID=A0ABY6FZU5_9MICO|nr:HNH endonuclease signature motif containing protein [Brachybacterium huguangmaarense]UYG16121.1 HNH endonuclease [Brachybacterium huguangmaarense]
MTGELVAMDSRARAFPAPLEQMVRWRESTCASPWCNATVRHIDHVAPHAHGGATSYANAQGLCVRCNLLKDHAGWIVTPTRDDDGAPAVTWVSPGGATTTCHLTPLGPRGPDETHRDQEAAGARMNRGGVNPGDGTDDTGASRGCSDAGDEDGTESSSSPDP